MALDAQRRVGAKLVALRLLGDQRPLGRRGARADGDRDGGVGRQRLLRHKGQPAPLPGVRRLAACRWVRL